MLPVLAQVVRHLAPTPRVQLAEQVMNVRLCCCQADVQPAGDLFVTEPGPDQFGSLPFAFGEWGYREGAVASIVGAGAESDPAEQPGSNSGRADLLAAVDLDQQSHDLGRTGSARDIADYARLGPRNDVLFRLP